MATVNPAAIPRQRSRQGLAIALTVALVSCDADPPPGIEPIANHSVRISPDSATVFVGSTLQLAAQIRDGRGRPIAGRTIAWSSSSSGIAGVDAAGLVAAAAAGTTLVIASSEGIADSAEIKVIEGPVGPVGQVVITFLQPPLIIIGDTVRLTATVLDATGDTIAGAPVIWTSSNPSVASVDGAGLVQGMAADLISIRAFSGTVGDTIMVRVFTISQLYLEPDRLRLGVGGRVTYTARSSIGTGAYISPGMLSWSSAQLAVASVDNGVATAVSPGTATITATRDNHSDQATMVIQSASGPVSFGAVSVGVRHSCAVAADGAYCWGSNYHGALGDGSTLHSAVPVRVAGGQTFSVVEASTWASCALTTAGSPWCWGERMDRSGYDSLPAQVPGGHVFRSIALNGISFDGGVACGITPAGELYCWGANTYGQLGVPPGGYQSAPVRVPLSQPVSAVTVGNLHVCALTTAGAAYCWGADDSYQLGVGNNTALAQCSGGSWCSGPVPVAGGHTFISLSVSYNTSCGLTTAGSVYCWGSRMHAGEPYNGPYYWPVPEAVASGWTFTSVTLGNQHACGVTPSGAAYCWFDNDEGQFGNGTRTGSLTPQPVAGGLSFRGLRAGSHQVCGISTGGTAWCWGWGEFGALGNNANVRSSVPVKVAGQP